MELSWIMAEKYGLVERPVSAFHGEPRESEESENIVLRGLDIQSDICNNRF